MAEKPNPNPEEPGKLGNGDNPQTPEVPPQEGTEPDQTGKKGTPGEVSPQRGRL